MTPPESDIPTKGYVGRNVKVYIAEPGVGGKRSRGGLDERGSCLGGDAMAPVVDEMGWEECPPRRLGEERWEVV
jgi:hypothetical protein